ncbi:MAG: hypothetical protein ACR2RA_23110 [Geminicoccaceae bacterium]
MFAIETSAKWWDLVDSYWDDLMAIVAKADRVCDFAELDRCRRARDVRLSTYLVDIRRTLRRRFDLKRTFGCRLLADLCLDRSILHQAVVWRG